MSDRRPEQNVLDAIAELVDESLARGPTDDYGREWLARCETCGHDWHGLNCGECYCPGAYASNEQRAARPAPPIPDATPFDVRDWIGNITTWPNPFGADPTVTRVTTTPPDDRCAQCRRHLTPSTTAQLVHTAAGGTQLFCVECTDMRSVAAGGTPTWTLHAVLELRRALWNRRVHYSADYFALDGTPRHE